MLALCSPALDTYARARELSVSDPQRFRALALVLIVHATAALAFALVAVVAERSFGKRLPWGVAALGAFAVFSIATLEIVEANADDQSGLGGMTWLLGALLGLPMAATAALLTTWWVVRKAGLSSTVWCAVCAVAYVALIAMHQFGHL